MNPELVKHLLKAPPTQLDPRMFDLIRKWASPPKAIEILEVLDHCINGSLASGFVVTLLTLSYEDACKAEGTTPKEVAKFATWRN